MKNVELEAKIVGYFAERENILAVYLFGSFAKDQSKKSSDVDIAILCAADCVPDFVATMAMKEDLISLLGRDVDLVVLNQANPILKHQVYKYGHLIFKKPRREVADFFVKSLMEYDDIKVNRAQIERQIERRKFYGG